MFSIRNPIYEKDKCSAVRNRAYLIAIVAVNGIISIIAMAVFANMVRLVDNSSQNEYAFMLQIYIVIAMTECLFVLLIFPGIAGVSLSHEKDKKNLEVYYSSGITAGKIIAGKFAVCTELLVVMVITAIPALSLVFVYGGIRLKDMADMLLALIFTGIEAIAVSLCCAAFTRKSGKAVVTAYGAMLILVAGTLLVNYAPLLLYGNQYGDSIGSPIAWYHYLLLINPAVSFFAVMNKQAGSSSAVFDIINYQGNYRNSWVTENWMALSIAVQLLLIILCIVLAGWKMKKERIIS